MKLKEHIVTMVPNSRTHIILVSFRMQKRKKKILYRIQSALTHPIQPLPDDTHTYCNASWNTENQDIREAVAQSAQRGQSCALWEGREGCDLVGRLNLRPSHPAPPTYKQMEF